MRSNFAANVIEVDSKYLPKDQISCEEGSFDTIPAQDGQAQLLIIAQAFHWIGQGDSDTAKKAAKEFHRVLAPGGILALIWNLEDRGAAPWVAQLRDSYEKHEQGTPQYRLGYWKSLLTTTEFQERFESKGDENPTVYESVVPTANEVIVERVLSKSYITALGETEKEEVVKMAREVVANGEGMQTDDAGLVLYPYKTDLWLFNKK